MKYIRPFFAILILLLCGHCGIRSIDTHRAFVKSNLSIDASDEEVLTSKDFPEAADDLLSVQFSPDGKWIAGAGLDHKIYVYEASSGRVMKMIEGHSDTISKILFSNDSKRIYSSSWDHSIREFMLETGKEIRKIEFSSSVVSFDLSSDNKLIFVADNRGGLQIYNFELGRMDPTLKIPERRDSESWFHDIAVLPDGKSAIAVYGSNLFQWDIASGQILRDYSLVEGQPIPWGYISRITLSRDGTKLAVVSLDHGFVVFEVAKSIQLTSFNKNVECKEEHADFDCWSSWLHLSAVRFSRDGLKVAGAVKSDIHVWDLATKKVLYRLESDGSGRGLNSIHDFDFSPDGAQVVAASDRNLKLWVKLPLVP